MVIGGLSAEELPGPGGRNPNLTPRIAEVNSTFSNDPPRSLAPGTQSHCDRLLDCNPQKPRVGLHTLLPDELQKWYSRLRMRSMLSLILTLGIALGHMGGEPPRSTIFGETVYSLIGEIGPSTLDEPGKASAVKSFDVSPDGTQLALLYETWKTQTGVPENHELWIAFWDRSAQKIVRRMQLAKNDLPIPTHGTDPNGPIFNENYLYMLRLRRDLIVSADQNFMIAMALGRVWILDARTCSMIRPINPPELERVAPVQIQIVSNSVFAIVYQDSVQHFRVRLFELSSGKQIAEWPSTVIPDSFSPDGMLAVAPDPDKRNGGGVTNVQLLNARDGTKIKSIPVGFGFKKNRFGEPSANGLVISKFLSNEQIVVTPSADRDPSGQRSGSSLEIIDIVQGRVTREIAPRKLGPIGVLVVSLDRGHFAIESVEAQPNRIAAESRDPRRYTHEAILFASETCALEAAIPIFSAKAGGNVSLRVSGDASTVAMRLGDAVQIFRVK